ncbi:aldehyde ferredoxin oxidoreductase [candidate division TA06 bacterium]|uniref:Aldehyde ferredoxin oxidoreductase n=1 Tax=candidate division TA06 bacterium TaxID=2250710 RepID=A0A523XUM0_UNCT6|nr:MAG: aldehyde ferredoxin oxidoreductase [candidate division TA06 bacterium]
MPFDKKIAYIGLTGGKVEVKPIPPELRELYLGGRGLDVYLLYNHLKAGTNPLSPRNVMVVSAGFLGATLASASARCHVAARSPLTGFLGSSNMGGFFGPELRWAGFDHLVIKGRAKNPGYLWSNNGSIEVRDASHLWGMNSYDTQDSLREELRDEEIQIMCVGQAGENLVRFANVRTGRKNAGGRTGMGAVMGSKNLKAIAVRGTMDVKIAHPEEALKYNNEVVKALVSTKFGRIMQRWGTMFIYGVTNSTGLIRVRNFQDNQFPDSEGLECENIEEASIGTSGCFGCELHCRHRYVIREGPYKGTFSEGPEYTSQGAWGAEVGCKDFNTVLSGNHLANYYGLDTLETGSLIAWAMELFQKGIITERDTNGLKLEFGNNAAVLEMIERIALRKDLGDVLAEGPLGAAKRIGKESEKYLIQVKGMSNLHSDERMTPSLALGIATASRGSDHLRSRPAIDLYHLPEPVLRKIFSNPTQYDGPLTSDYTSYEGKARMVQWQEMLYMAVDCLGICKFHTVFLSPNMLSFDHFSELLYYNTGLRMTPQKIWNIADRAYTLERLFNLREGLKRDDDWLVDRYFDEKTPSGLDIVRNKSLDRKKFKAMIDEYYELHGWDRKGVPTTKTLEELGLDKEPSHML